MFAPATYVARNDVAPESAHSGPRNVHSPRTTTPSAHGAGDRIVHTATATGGVFYLNHQGTNGEGRVKVTCLQENLAHGLAIVGRGVSTRGSLPILSDILLRTDAGRLKLTATNLEVGINCWVPAKVEVEGAIPLPPKLFIDFVNSLPSGQADPSRTFRGRTATRGTA